MLPKAASASRALLLLPAAAVPTYCGRTTCEANMNQRSTPKAETPRSEPDILLPGEPAGRGRWDPRGWQGEESVHRIYVSKVGPFSLALFGLAAAAVAALVLTFVIGAFLIAIPIAGLLLAAAIISGVWRGATRPSR
jgi:hypothetical protein